MEHTKPAQKTRVYSKYDFVGFLPSAEPKVGDLWSIQEGLTQRLLSQFNPRVATLMNLDGSGSYAVLRARSERYYDVVFRLHAQFELIDEVFFNPSQFAGRIVIDRHTAEVAYFEAFVPQDHYRNLDFEVFEDSEDAIVGLALIPRMELKGGQMPEVEWEQEVSEEAARRQLAQEFFPFEALDWLPLKEAISRSQVEEKPILAVVIEGALNDQSC